MKKYLLFVFIIIVIAAINSCTKESTNPPIADFSFTGAGTVPCQVVFENKSSYATDYQWSFGDGTSSTETNPTKTYSVAGTYNVTLTATGRGSATVTKQIVTQQPRPAVMISASPMNIYLPNNCARSFVITNSGPQGSILDYAVYDNGALGGFLDYTNGTGSLAAGSSATISVTVDPLFVSGQLSTGATLVLDVSTPQASNFTHLPVAVYIRSMADQAQNLLGTWNGTWSGNSFGAANPAQPQPTSPVSGTWTLNVQSFDPANNTVTGTVNFSGTDAYWTYTFNSNGNITSATPQPFTANQTITLNSSNSSLAFPAISAACDRFRLLINDLQGSSYGVYGPRLLFDLDLRANTVITSGSSFVAWPYAPVYINNLSSNQSNGSLSGRKL